MPSGVYQPSPSQAYSTFANPPLPGDAPLTATSQRIDTLFGVSANIAVVEPTNPVQETLKRKLPQYATNPIAGALAGTVVALVATGLLSFILFLISNLLGGSAKDLDTYPLAQALTSVGFLNFVALEHHATLVIGANTDVYSTALAMIQPVPLLLVIPAVSLALGGYISAATDYSNQLRFVLLRAAAVSVGYAALLTVVVAAFGTHKGADGTPYSAPWLPLLINSFIWAVLFSLVGGMLKIFGAQWRGGTVAYLLSRPRVMGTAAFFGAVAALGTGLALSFVYAIYQLGYAAVDGSVANAPDPTVANHPLQVFFLALLAQGPGDAITNFALGSGATITSLTSTSYSLFKLPADALISPWLLALLPLAAFIVGGRTAARVMHTTDPAKGAQAGALMGVISAFLLVLVTSVATTTEAQTADGSTGVSLFAQGSASTQTSGPNPISTFIAALIVGVILGALGGYFARPLPALPTRSFLASALALGDALTGRTTKTPRAAARAWLYGAALVSILALIGGIVYDLVTASLAHRAIGTSTDLHKVIGFANTAGVLSGLVLTVPLLVFAAALLIDLGSLPANATQLAQMIVPPAPPAPEMPPSAPYQPQQMTYTGPYMPPSVPLENGPRGNGGL